MLGGVPNRIDVGMCSAEEGIGSIARRRPEMKRVRVNETGAPSHFLSYFEQTAGDGL
jgi:hypothetical protein